MHRLGMLPFHLERRGFISKLDSTSKCLTRVSVASAKDRGFDGSKDCPKGQQFERLSLNFSSGKALAMNAWGLFGFFFFFTKKHRVCNFLKARAFYLEGIEGKINFTITDAQFSSNTPTNIWHLQQRKVTI